MLDIGSAISIGLKKRKMKQKDLAAIMEVSPQTAGKWISNKVSPSADKVLKIINLLDIHEEVFGKKVISDVENEERRKIYSELSSLREDIDWLKSQESSRIKSDKNLDSLTKEFSVDEIMDALDLLREFSVGEIRELLGNLRLMKNKQKSEGKVARKLTS